MPDSSVLVPHVVMNRDAAVAGVFSVDGNKGAIDLTTKYVQIVAYNQKIGTIEAHLTTIDGSITSINTSIQNINTALGNKAAKGANSDITSISGLTTALSITQGGTGAKNAADARTALGLERVIQTPNASYVNSPDGKVGLNVTNSGWYFYNLTTKLNVPADISMGGTGALNIADARNNLNINRLAQNTGGTSLYSPDGNVELNVNNTGWFFYNATTKSNIPASINMGGTGALNATDARTNLGLGASNYPTFSGWTISNSYYVGAVWVQTSRASTEFGARLSLEISPTANTNPYFVQGRNDGTATGRVLNNLPLRGGYIAVKQALKVANPNFDDYRDTDTVTFVSSTTANNAPFAGYGVLASFGEDSNANGSYTSQLAWDKNSNGSNLYSRTRTDVTGTYTPWTKITTSATSDERLKDIKGDLNVEGSLDNINRMDFKIFSFKKDETGRYRRGVISQQIRLIDKDYVNNVGGFWHLDQTPMLLDGLAAIKALKARDEANKETITSLESRVEKLEGQIFDILTKLAN